MTPPRAVFALTLALTFASGPAAAQMTDGQIERIRAVIDGSGFSGDVAFTDQPDGRRRYAYHGLLPEPVRGDTDGLTWRWASVTKQIVAILVMQQVEAGTIDLDTTVGTYVPTFASELADSVTIRQLLQHQSGLPNPDDTLGEAYPVPEFYQPGYDGNRDPLTGYCAGEPAGISEAAYVYNNCDYMVLGAVLEAVTGESWQQLFATRIAEPLELDFAAAYPGEEFTRRGYIDDTREPEYDLSSYGASAGLYGSKQDLLKIDMALLDGRLLGDDALAEMWDADPALGYMALGQWVFPALLDGCSEPTRIVERRGAIGAVQVRNFILPDLGIAMVAFSDRAPFDFGEIWTGAGFSHDLLAAALCPVGDGDKE